MFRLLLICAFMLPIGCDSFLSDDRQPAPMPEVSLLNVVWDGIPLTLAVRVQQSGYDENQVVLRAVNRSLGRTLMLTFDRSTGHVAVNPELTGFWDLGLCVPGRSDDFRLLSADDARITLDTADGRVSGTFEARFVDSEGREATFSDGVFNVAIERDPFTHCIEG